MIITITKLQLCEQIKNGFAVKTTSRTQAKELIGWLQEVGLGFNWYIIWDEVKMGSIFAVIDGKLIYDRDAVNFPNRKIITFKSIKIKEV